MANQILFKPTPENYQGLTDARATDDLCVTDHEGLLRAIPPGELPFEKARVVKNLLADVSGAGSEDLNTATATGTVNSATTWTPSATGNAVYFDVTTAASEEYVVSFKLKVVSGTNYTPSIYHNNSATGNTTSITATGTQQRFSVKVSGRTGGGAVSFGIYEGHATPGGTYTITEFQVENVTGQTNQNPSEYVSVNVGDGTELLATHDYTDWAPELNNTCTDGGDGSVLITAVDSSNGAKLDLGALSPDLETSNIDYVVTYEAKVNSGSSVNVILNNETPAYSQEVTSTSYTSYIAYIQYDGSGDFTMQTTGMTTGVEIINVRNVSVQKATTGFAQYSTANGNTVNATTKVVTEATGAALSPVPYLRHVPAATNLVPEATNLSNWTNDGNGGTTLTANAGISPFGAYDAFEVAQIDSIFDFIREEIGVLATSTEHTCSLLIKNVDSTLTRWIAGYNISDGSNPYIDITWTGAVPSISGKDTSVSGDTVYALDNDWYLITLQFTTSITSSGHRLQIYPEFSATATNSILFGGCQLEASSFATPLIETTGASASRNATAIQTPLNTGAGGNFNQTEGALEITYVPEQDVNDLTAVMSVLDIGGTNAVLSHASGGAIQAKDGTNTADTPAAVHDAGDKITAGVAWDTTGNSLRVGYKNVTDATSWVWDADSANYDGGFDASSGNIELFNGATNIYQIHSLVVQDAVATTAEIEAGLPVANDPGYNETASASASSSAAAVDTYYSPATNYNEQAAASATSAATALDTPGVDHVDSILASATSAATALDTPGATHDDIILVPAIATATALDAYAAAGNYPESATATATSSATAADAYYSPPAYGEQAAASATSAATALDTPGVDHVDSAAASATSSATAVDVFYSPPAYADSAAASSISAAQAMEAYSAAYPETATASAVNSVTLTDYYYAQGAGGGGLTLEQWLMLQEVHTWLGELRALKGLDAANPVSINDNGDTTSVTTGTIQVDITDTSITRVS